MHKLIPAYIKLIYLFSFSLI
ncbi:hypothetical protein TRIP_B240005 [uncultured Desulfatiglans sp.]|uniref:Uncharacterized protein n=1 Tax=Uncultured Desulfatiglans sp. TaxID=1748965 RepID=A0A653A5D3_UNCDX|nr:hypothetical protein TRIP_B240005 [uncultured Desulfatiglans sp.]